MQKNMTTLCHAYLESRKRGETTAIKFKKAGQWQELSWQAYWEEVRSFGSGLLSLGIQSGDKIAILAQTRYEWAIADLAVLGCGAVTVPIYPSNTEEEISFIINNADITMLIAENRDQIKKWRNIAAECPKTTQVISIESISKTDRASGMLAWDDMMKKGREFLTTHPEAFIERCQQAKPDDVATIIYTSGTTGQPKGVVLPHSAAMSQVNEVFAVVGLNAGDCSLTFLPLSHVFGRVESWGFLVHGYCMAFAESIDKIRANLQEIKPTFLIAVPRIFEKIYNGIRNQVEMEPLKKQLFDWAVGIGKAVGSYKMQHKAVPLTLAVKYQVARKLVFNKILEKLGGNLRFAFSGGAPLAKYIGEFFHAAGILIIEGYGLTETTAAITTNSPYDYRFSTVGKPFGDVEIKIADDGEILVKSAKIFREYYKNPEATAEVLKDGWFATGDIGEFSSDGFLRITDRKKDLIKTSGGKYVAPQRLEALLKQSKHISNVLIHGDQRKYIVALVTLDPILLREYAEAKALQPNDPSELIETAEVRELVRTAVAEANTQLASYESIKNFAILPRDFTIEDGELTPSMKVKRKYCDKKYRDVLDNLYGVDTGRM